MMAVHEKKPLPLVAPVLVVVVAFFNLDILCNWFDCAGTNPFYPFDGYCLY